MKKILTGVVIMVLFTGLVRAEHDNVFSVKWGKDGLGFYNRKNAPDFDEPWALGPVSLKVTPQNNFLVVDRFNNSVKIFAGDGEIIKSIDSAAAPYGTAPFKWLGDCAVDSHGNIYITDMAQSTIYKIDRTGKVVLSFGGYGQKPEHLVRVHDLVVDSFDRVIVGDFGRAVLNVYNKKGELDFSVDWERTGFCVDDEGNIFCLNYIPAGKDSQEYYNIIKYDLKGKANRCGRIFMPEVQDAVIRGMDSAGNIYVSFINPLDRSQFVLLSFNQKGEVTGEFENVTMSTAEVQFAVTRDGEVYHLSFDAEQAPKGAVQIKALKRVIRGQG